jgi:hypothetical protein
VNRETPITRLRPGGRGDTIPAATRMVPATTGRESATNQHSGLREWHAMSPTQRQTAWVELVEWVIWLHDRYELATEHRIPHCWTQHPGLIEELWALKCWREQIYTAEQPSAQAARYWHAELRQVIQAAGTFYAKGCRSGHKPPTQLAIADPALQRRWLAADPLTGVPPKLLTVTEPIAADAIVMSDPHMRAAITAGLARPLGAQIGDYQHYQGHWWHLVDGAEGTWEQITDPVFAKELDRRGAAMAIADSIVEKHQTISDALS